MTRADAFNMQGRIPVPKGPVLTEEAFFEAVEKGDRETLRAMLKAKPDYALATLTLDEHGGRDGSAGLHIAAKKGHLGIVADLLDAGATLEARDFVRQTPLMVAAQSGQAHVVKFLLQEMKADPNLHASEGYTALMYAARKGCPACVTLLLDAGADINAVMGGKLNALHFAAFAEKNAQETADILLKRGIAFDAPDNIGQTPALSARKAKNEDLAVFIETWPERKAALQEQERLELAKIKDDFRAGTQAKVTAPRRPRFTPKQGA